MKQLRKNYEKTFLKTTVTIPAIYTVHYFRYGRNFRISAERHNFWELIYIDSGTAKILAGNNHFTLSQGEAFIHQPNEIHTIYTEDVFANSAIISFDCQSKAIKELSGKILYFDENQKALLKNILQEAKNCYHDKLNDVYLKKMSKKSNPPLGGDQIIKNCIELLLISLFRAENRTEIEPLQSAIEVDNGDTVKKINTILQRKLDNGENVSLEEISDELGFSKSYVKTVFKQKKGKSVLQFFIYMKIEKAKMLLSQHNYTVTEIADMLGFNSVFYFSRQFKNVTDMSPTEYINSIKADNLL